MRNEIALRSQVTLQVFEKLEIYFFKPINPPIGSLGSIYIITATEYLTRWAEEAPIKDCNIETTPHLLF
jgi:hypothetical protein